MKRASAVERGDSDEGSARAAPTQGLTITVDVEQLANRVAALVAEHLVALLPPTSSPWVDVDGAAAHLSCSRERIRKLIARKEIPFHQARPNSRVFLNRHELDDWLLNQ